jgi:hypothetical protein
MVQTEEGKNSITSHEKLGVKLSMFFIISSKAYRT